MLRAPFRPPMLAVAAALLGLIALLATLQYRWVGRISDAERERLTATLAARAAAFAQDVDRELTLAYLLFQGDPFVRPGNGGDGAGDGLAAHVAGRRERWQSAARYPRLIRDFYLASEGPDGDPRLHRFAPASRTLEPADWPDPLAGLRAALAARQETPSGSGTLFIRAVAGPLADEVPAVVVPLPRVTLGLPARRDRPHFAPSLSYILLVLDREYMTGEMFPDLARHHFLGIGDGPEYQLAIVHADRPELVYHSSPAFRPAAGTKADAAADLFQIRTHEFPQMTADVRRFISATSLETERVIVDASPRAGAAPPPLPARENLVVRSVTSDARGRPAARWRLLVKHPSGSLEAAVGSARRRNLLISTSVLAVLAASMGLLVASTRRSQALARQQMEFVATVSHELRTPLAVIRSAADNLADGVVHDEAQVRRYGALVRSEGRRLTEMVEQILEFAGLQSGQRAIRPAAVPVDRVIAAALRDSAPLVEDARVEVDLDLPPDLPPVAGDEASLRRVFQNLIGNAVKYGGDARWVGIAARHAGGEVRVTVTDRGIGIAPADQERIFQPFYRAADASLAQIQGAGLGLSLVQRIVRAHGGRVRVASARGQGSAFTVHLPAATGHAATVADPAGADGGRDAAGAAAPAPRPT